ncbi:MAG TPA: ATP-binding protein [Candidatus Eisenbacteria bacterium]|nr:ATP-binding protein [Candidatus Eisenbacteria bacterium]
MTTPRTSIRGKLVTAMMLTSTTVLVLTGAALVLYDLASFRQSLARSLATRAEILAANSTAALAFDNRDDATQVLAALRSDPSTVMAVLYDHEGRPFAAYPADVSLASVPAAPSGKGHWFEPSSVVVSRPVVEEGQTLGTLYLKSDLRALAGRVRIFTLVVVVAVLGSIAVAFALASWLQRGIALPVRTLADTARQVSDSKDFAIRANVVSDDELGLLTHSFNEMLSEIQQRDAALRASETRLRQLNGDLERRVEARTAQLETSNRELEAFSYSVSHDLRAPLRHIDGFADLLRRQAHSGLDDKAKRYIETISASAKSMGMLIDDLLSFSRMGRSELQNAPVDLDELVAEVRAAVSSDVADREIVWTVAPLPRVVGDPAMLRLALVNLLSNAVKYTRGRTPARITVGATEAGHETVLFVQDNGAGFDMAYQGKLFGVFQRLHGAEEFEGTGIGLANVRRIIERHRGRVWAKGELGAGATFFVALPREDSEANQDQEAA